MLYVVVLPRKSRALVSSGSQQGLSLAMLVRNFLILSLKSVTACFGFSLVSVTFYISTELGVLGVEIG
jgi:hypothetical protein